MRNQPTTRRSARGLTLMEALVVIGVMAMLMLIIGQIFVLNYDIFEKQSSRTDTETGAVLAAKTVSQMTRGSSAVVTSHAFGTDTHISSEDTLVLQMPALNASKDILPGLFDYVAVYRDPVETTKVFLVTDAATGSIRTDHSRLITAYNEQMIFRYNYPDITKADRVSMFLVNSQTKRDTTVITKGWTSIFLRNY